MLSPTHIVFLLLVILLALVVFGPKRLPELGSSVGKALQEFRKASASTMDEVRSVSSSVNPAHPAHPAPASVEAQPSGVEPAVSAPPVAEPKPTD